MDECSTKLPAFPSSVLLVARHYCPILGHPSQNIVQIKIKINAWEMDVLFGLDWIIKIAAIRIRREALDE